MTRTHVFVCSTSTSKKLLCCNLGRIWMNHGRQVREHREREYSTREKTPLVILEWTTNLHAWFADYNQQNPEQKCPDEVLLPSCSKELLNKWLCGYVVETRSKDGNPYPPKTVSSVQNNGRTLVNFRPFHEDDRSYCNLVGLMVRP